MKVGVLALQGDFEAHSRVLARAGASTVPIRTPEDLGSVDALVIPGGESTTIRKLAKRFGLLAPVRERARAGMPVMGTCAGMIACAMRIVDGDEPIFPLVDVTVRRNAYGRQVDSFETDLSMAVLGDVRAVFIRAPWIEGVGPEVEVLAEHAARPVAVRQGRVLLLAFHPELTDDDRIHRAFLGMG